MNDFIEQFKKDSIGLYIHASNYDTIKTSIEETSKVIEWKEIRKQVFVRNRKSRTKFDN